MTTLSGNHVVSDRCAFIISNVYEAYDFYSQKILNTMLDYEMNFLSSELEQAEYEAE